MCARRGVRANYLRADERRALNKITASAFPIDVPRAGSNPSLMIRRPIGACKSLLSAKRIHMDIARPAAGGPRSRRLLAGKAALPYMLLRKRL
jgi:hypothetical protein